MQLHSYPYLFHPYHLIELFLLIISSLLSITELSLLIPLFFLFPSSPPPQKIGKTLVGFHHEFTPLSVHEYAVHHHLIQPPHPTEITSSHHLISRLTLVESSFSCLLCLAKSQNTYDLCCTCYRGRKFKHEHQFKYLVDTYSLVKLFIDQRTADADQRSKEKVEMEQMHKIARSHYQAGTPEVKKLAQKFFNSIDTNGDKRVNLEEFLTFMGQQGYEEICNPKLFKELDKDGSGTLDFDELITLYYIVKSERPFCDSCKNFISGVYFSCVDCFKTRQSSFRMCHDCYAKPKHSHEHNGRSQFLDNYTLLLEATKVSADDGNGRSKFLDNSVPADALGVNQGNLKTTIKAVDIANLAVKIGSIAATSVSTATIVESSIM